MAQSKSATSLLSEAEWLGINDSSARLMKKMGVEKERQWHRREDEDADLDFLDF